MYVYIMRRESGGPCKIGISRDLRTRRNVISNGVDEICDVIFLLLPSVSAFAIERRVHSLLAEFDMGHEWFAVTPETAIRAVCYVGSQNETMASTGLP